MQQPQARREKRLKPNKRTSSAGRPTSEELERRKRRVLEVATKLFMKQGYEGTSFVQISKAAGVGANMMYQHFGDKEQLFKQAVYARETNTIDETPKLKPEDTLFTVLLRTARYTIDVALRERSAGIMRLIIAESQRFPALTRAVADKSLENFIRHLASLFDDLIRAGITKAHNTRQSAKLFVDLILGVTPLRHYANWESAHPSDDELGLKVKVFIKGVLEA